MDNRIDLVKTVKNLRRVSVSPWANKPIMAEKLGHDYVYSLKVSPTPLSMPNLAACRTFPLCEIMTYA
jgi:hypothetical protein